MPQPSRGAAVAMLLSLAVHGLFALVVFFIPGPAPRTSVDACVVNVAPALSLSLAELSTPPATAATPAREEPEFSVVVTEPSSTPVVTTEVRAPTVTAKPAASGPGNAGGNGPAGGSGTATGGRPSLLDAPQPARRVVYVIDRSLSMGPSRALNRARHELLNALARLPAGATFQVILYNRRAELLRIDGRSGFLPADATTRAAVALALESTTAEGSTDHLLALRQGLVLRPDVLFLVTDAAELTDRDVQEVTRVNAARTAIHVIELSRHRGDADGPVRSLALHTGGSYRRESPE
jgi:hypothetical protein